METRINKPKVFLSHAWKNKPFIQRVAGDLRRCQIEPWLDEEEIRDGRSWLKMIFEDGIPTCDAVLVYFTEESLNSKMVERELDAAVVHQLDEGGVRLLPYVSEESIRDQLRSDLKTLHCRAWNNDNYDDVLPTVIAEIWRSYLERTIETAVLQEKSRRLEQELENKRLREKYESSMFSAREDEEFQYLREKLSKQVEVTFELFTDHSDDSGDNRSRNVGTEVCQFNILHLLLVFMDNGLSIFDIENAGFYLARAIPKTFSVDNHTFRRSEIGTIDSEIATRTQNELQTYGLTRIRRDSQWGIVYENTDKMYRFKYWLDYNNLQIEEPLDHTVTLNIEDRQISERETDEAHLTAQVQAADKIIRQARLRKAWSTNGEGTKAVVTDIQWLFEALKDRASKSNKVSELFQLSYQANSNRCSITTGYVTLLVEGNCPSQKTDDCRVKVSVEARELSVVVQFGQRPGLPTSHLTRVPFTSGDALTLPRLSMTRLPVFPRLGF